MRKQIVDRDIGETRFWDILLAAICDREAKIHAGLDAGVVKKVLLKLARLTRSKLGDVGPISISEINQCFEEVTGLFPADESAAILQRLPLLGRIGPESLDRQFVDSYFLDGLRAEDLLTAVFLHDDAIVNEQWTNPLGPFGLRVLRSEIEKSPDANSFVHFMRQGAKRRNRLLAGEIAMALLDANDAAFDFGGLHLYDTNISEMNLVDAHPQNLTIEQSIIGRLDLTNVRAENISVRNCMIEVVEGVSEAKGLPEWMKDNDVGLYRSVSTVSRIKSLKLSTYQRIFVAIIKKTFFQPGSGRKEEALVLFSAT